MSDEFCKKFLGDPNTKEVLGWLKGGSGEDFRSLGELARVCHLALESLRAGITDAWTD